jgi:hypothetical protein
MDSPLIISFEQVLHFKLELALHHDGATLYMKDL